jgi:hypothetical protein
MVQGKWGTMIDSNGRFQGKLMEEFKKSRGNSILLK